MYKYVVWAIYIYIMGQYILCMQRYGQGPANKLPLEANGDYTRELGFLKVADFTSNVTEDSSYDNLLNNIWYQPEEVFPIYGTPEQRQHAFWVPVDPFYYYVAKTLKVLITIIIHVLLYCLNIYIIFFYYMLIIKLIL